ncbi:MAG: hypothetical protein V1899_03000 [Planctomycetota bacterium]
MDKILVAGSVLLMILAIAMQVTQKYWMADWLVFSAIYYAIIALRMK